MSILVVPLNEDLSGPKKRSSVAKQWFRRTALIIDHVLEPLEKATLCRTNEHDQHIRL